MRFICKGCWKKTFDFHEFYEFVESKHKTFKSVVECKLEVFNDVVNDSKIPSKDEDIIFESIKVEPDTPELLIIDDEIVQNECHEVNLTDSEDGIEITFSYLYNLLLYLFV